MAAGGSPVAAAATGAVRFVPLLGVDSQQPLSYLLELDGFVILLDCGWNDSYDPDLLQPVVAVLPRVDAGKQAAAASAGCCPLLTLLGGGCPAAQHPHASCGCLPLGSPRPLNASRSASHVTAGRPLPPH